MSSLEVLNSLWGGTIYNLETDLLLQRSKFYIKILENDILKFYELVFTGLLTFNIINEKILPWNYVELTEIHFSKEKDFNFTLILWSETHTINIVCKKWQLNIMEEFNEKK